MPETAATTLQKLLEANLGTLRYLKVYMKLSDVIDGDFFNQYIKSGRSAEVDNSQTRLILRRKHLDALRRWTGS